MLLLVLLLAHGNSLQARLMSAMTHLPCSVLLSSVRRDSAVIQQDVRTSLQRSRVTGSAHDRCSGRQAGVRRLRKLASLVRSAILWAEVDERGGSSRRWLLNCGRLLNRLLLCGWLEI